MATSTACASGGSAIQLGVEAIRRGEAEAALVVGTDASINPESLIRFSLLSALSTRNDPPQAAARPFSKDRDGFVMAKGAGALVLESLVHAQGTRRERSSACWKAAARWPTGFIAPARRRTASRSSLHAAGHWTMRDWRRRRSEPSSAPTAYWVLLNKESERLFASVPVPTV